RCADDHRKEPRLRQRKLTPPPRTAALARMIDPPRRLPAAPLTPAQRTLVAAPAARGVVQRLARRLGRRYRDICSEDDLAGAGELGLAQAARLFDPSLGVTFEVFAWSRVHGAMMRWVRREFAHARAAREGAYRMTELARDEVDPWNDGEAEHRARLERFSDAL